MLPKHPQPASQPPSQYGPFELRETRSLLEVFVRDLGQFKNAASQFICELQIKLASFWLRETRIPSEAFFSGFGALQKSGLPICELLMKLAAVGERLT